MNTTTTFVILTTPIKVLSEQLAPDAPIKKCSEEVDYYTEELEEFYIIDSTRGQLGNWNYTGSKYPRREYIDSSSSSTNPSIKYTPLPARYNTPVITTPVKQRIIQNTAPVRRTKDRSSPNSYPNRSSEEYFNSLTFPNI